MAETKDQLEQRLNTQIGDLQAQLSDAKERETELLEINSGKDKDLLEFAAEREELMKELAALKDAAKPCGQWVDVPSLSDDKTKVQVISVAAVGRPGVMMRTLNASGEVMGLSDWSGLKMRDNGNGTARVEMA